MKKLLAAGLIILLSLSLVACAPKGVAEEEFKDLGQDYFNVKEDYEQLSKDYDDMTAELDFFQSEYDILVEENESLRSDLEKTKLGLDPNPADEGEETEEEPSDEEETETYDIEIVKEFISTDDLNYTTRFLVVKNLSDKTLDISSSTIAYDKNDKEIDSCVSGYNTIGSDCTSILWESYELAKSTDRFETKINAEFDEWFDSALEYLSFERKDIEDGTELTVTNNGSKAATSVEAMAIFLKDGKMVDYFWTFFSDENWELQAGKSMTEEMTTSQAFDSIEIYLTGFIPND